MSCNMSFLTIALVILFVQFAHSAVGAGIQYKYTCMAAREYYKAKNSDIDFNLIDPVFHYQNNRLPTKTEWPLHLCNPPALYPDSSACNCTSAIDQFNKDYPQLKSRDALTSWTANYLNEGLVWHCEKCPSYSHFTNSSERNKKDTTTGSRYAPRADNSTTSTGSGSTTSPDTSAVPSAHRCLAARLDYWIRVAASRESDPVFYYTQELQKGNTPPSWNGALCDFNPVYLTATTDVVQCASANDEYGNRVEDSRITRLYKTPFEHFLRFEETAGYPWHAERCPGAVTKLNVSPRGLPQSCLCIAARQWYAKQHPSLLDPVYYYETYGINSTTSAALWNCDLCNPFSVKVDDSVCSQCPTTRSQYLLDHPDAVNYDNVFLHYWNGYLSTGSKWDCTACVPEQQPTNEPPTPAPKPTPKPFTTPDDTSCNCLAARNDYYRRYPEIDVTNTDAVYHYFHYNTQKTKTWNCAPCDAAPQQLNRENCGCEAAAAAYRAENSLASGDDAFAAWQANPESIWRCELCSIPDVLPVNASCDCLGARTLYNYTYPEIHEHGAVDPYYHYRWFGYKEGKAWNCDVCADSRAHFPTEPVCNCPEAQALFQATYPDLKNYPPYNPFAYWTNKFNHYGNSWDCIICSTRVSNPTASLTCNCTNARADYLARYPSVTIDPWQHYNANQRNTWDCQICNDTCPGVLTSISGMPAISWAYSGQQIPAHTPILYVLPGCFLPLNGTSVVDVDAIYLYGVVRCSKSANVSITANSISVAGTFECGTATEEFAGSLKITLRGVPMVDEGLDNGVSGNKALSVLDGGVLQLHGAKKSTWVRLATTAFNGSNTIQLDTVVDWQKGDKIVVTTTDAPSYVAGNNATSHSEEVVIASISGTTITLASPLAYTHLGQTYTIPGTGMTLKKYAEVGLISRSKNIVIAGDDSSSLSKYGAQVLILAGGSAYISGVVVAFGGQANKIFRYPIQWYDNKGTGQYLKSSTIINSFNRCLVLTATSRLAISNNLCYDVIGSGFVLETSLEQIVTIDANAVIKATRPSGYENYFSPEDVDTNGPAGFFVRNPYNYLTNNVVADSVGTGFWFKVGISNVWPNIPPNHRLSSFRYLTNTNNVVHSMRLGFVNCIAGPAQNVLTQVVNSMAIYSVNKGMYVCSQVVELSKSVIADAQIGMELTARTSFKSSALVNYITEPLFPSSVGVSLGYGDFITEGCFIVNYNTSTSSIFQPLPWAGFSTGSRLHSTLFLNSDKILSGSTEFISKQWQSYAGEWGTVLRDITGHAFPLETSIVLNSDMMRDETCSPLDGDGKMYQCQTQFIPSMLTFANTMVPNIRISRVPYDGIRIPSDFVPTAPTVNILPYPGTGKAMFATAIGGSSVYQVWLPANTDNYIAALGLGFSGQKFDYSLLQFFNVRSVSAGIKLDSCKAVFDHEELSYYFNPATSMACVRLTALNRTSGITDERSFGNLYGAFIYGGSNATYEPPAPYSGDKLALQPSVQCVAQMVKYWNTYPATIDIDPAYDYRVSNTLYPNMRTWDNEPCLDVSRARYIYHPWTCNCTAARERYSNTFNLPNTTDPYQHYMLYQQILGYAYHCEMCPLVSTPAPEKNDTAILKIREYDPKLSVGLGVLTGVGVLIAVVCAIFLAVYWEAFQKHGPLYCSLIVAGVLLSYIAVFVLLPEPTNALCLAFPWFLGVAFSLVYGCLFIKTWALYQVWRNAKNFQRSTLTPAYILKGILLYLGVEIVYLIIWFIVDPPSVKLEKLIDDTQQYTCKCKHIEFWVVFIVVKAVWLAFGAVLSFLTRNMVKEYNESKSIAYAIYNIVLLGVIGGPVVAYVQTSGVPGAVLVMEVVLIVLAFTFTLISLFGGIIYRIINPNKDHLGAKLSTLTQKRDGTGSKGSHNSKSSSAGFSDDHKTSSFDRSGVTHSGKTQEVYLA